MQISALNTFLSEDNIKRHVGYMKRLRHEYSILEKSIAEIKGKTPSEISGMNLKRSIKNEIIAKIQQIKSHETYFSSFLETPRPCPELKKFFSSENAFCFEVLELAKAHTDGFIYVFSPAQSRPTVKHSTNAPFVYVREEPTLALDLAEHSYFLDYGFEREKYLRAAIGHLNLPLLFE